MPFYTYVAHVKGLFSSVSGVVSRRYMSLCCVSLCCVFLCCVFLCYVFLCYVFIMCLEQESVEAYREVNVFLSKEVSELYELRSADQERISELKE